MVQAVLVAVGLLAAPRAVDTTQTDVQMTEIAKEQLQNARQSLLRDLLLQLLGARQGGLDLNDEGTRKLLVVPFERLRLLLRSRELSKLASAQQWGAIAGIVGVGHALPADASSTA